MILPSPHSWGPDKFIHKPLPEATQPAGLDHAILQASLARAAGCCQMLVRKELELDFDMPIGFLVFAPPIEFQYSKNFIWFSKVQLKLYLLESLLLGFRLVVGPPLQHAHGLQQEIPLT